MSEEGKVSGDQWYPIVLLDDTDFKTGETGKVVGDLTVEYKKLGAGAGWTAYAPAAGDWQELGDGEYAMNMGAGEFASAGRWQVHVQCAGALTYRFSVEVRSFTLEELYTGANLVTFYLKSIDVQNSAGDAVLMKSTGGNGKGLNILGNGTAPGLKVIGGASGPGIQVDGGGAATNAIEATGVTTGHGMILSGGATTGSGLKIDGGGTTGPAVYVRAIAGNAQAILLEGFGSGAGLKAVGGASGPGIQAIGGGANTNGIESTGVDAGNGMQLNGGVTGNGLKVYGGGTSGAAIRAIGQAGNAEAMLLEGQGSGNGLKATGGATGSGLRAEGGATSGNGIAAIAVASGDGIHAEGFSAGAGVAAQGGAAGHGIRAEGEGGGSGVWAEGAAGGDGITAYVPAASGGKGLNLIGSTAGEGLLAVGGIGGIKAQATAGNNSGIKSEGSGTGHGIHGQSGGGATGDGMCVEARSINGNGLNTIKTGTGIDLKATDHGDGSWQEDGFRKNTASDNFEFEMVQAADHITPALGAAITAQRSIDGGAYGACTNAAVEVGLGTYKINFSAADLNGDIITFKFSAAACDTRSITIKTYLP